jgi:hypothetical protein
MYEYDYDEFEASGGGWRNIAIIAAVGLGAYLAYQAYSHPEKTKELGRKARDAAKSVANKASSVAGSVREKASSMAGAVRDKVRGSTGQSAGEESLSTEESEQVGTGAPSGQFA